MIKFTPYKEQDIENRVKWLNNPNVSKFVGEVLGQKTSLKKEQKWFAEYKLANDKKCFVVNYNNQPVGFVGLSNISRQNKNADLHVVIGEDKYRGKGIGRKAVKWIVDYGFNKLKLHKINLGVVEQNEVAIKLYKSLGFEIEGKMKDEVFYNGKFYDFLSMAIFKDHITRSS